MLAAGWPLALKAAVKTARGTARASTAAGSSPRPIPVSGAAQATVGLTSRSASPHHDASRAARLSRQAIASACDMPRPASRKARVTGCRRRCRKPGSGSPANTRCHNGRKSGARKGGGATVSTCAPAAASAPATRRVASASATGTGPTPGSAVSVRTCTRRPRGMSLRSSKRVSVASTRSSAQASSTDRATGPSVVSPSLSRGDA